MCLCSGGHEVLPNKRNENTPEKKIGLTTPSLWIKKEIERDSRRDREGASLSLGG